MTQFPPIPSFPLSLLIVTHPVWCSLLGHIQWIFTTALAVLLVAEIRAAEATPSFVGVCHNGTPIPCLLPPNDELDSPKIRILLIGSNQRAKETVESAMKWYYRDQAAKPLRERFLLAAVPCSHPHLLPEGVQRLPDLPPYKFGSSGPQEPEERALWTWVAAHGPDVVLEVRIAKELAYHVRESALTERGDPPQIFGDRILEALGRLSGKLPKRPVAAGFAEWVSRLTVSAYEGQVPVAALGVGVAEDAADFAWLTATLEAIDAAKLPVPSPMRKELLARRERTPQQMAEELGKVYGRRLTEVAYILALPLVAKLRLARITGDLNPKLDVAEIVEPFLRRQRMPIPRSGSEQAGHLVFAELAGRSPDGERERWIELCRVAADQAFDKDGQPLPIVPFHNEMSDAVFMSGPILAATGKLTRETKYFDAAAIHFAAMRKLCLREDGIYRHSPLCEAAWGRGNGFPALGLAWALSEWPDDHPAKKELIGELQRHLAALKPHQDTSTGCWHQVIDQPESYDEYSCTCMIGWAMQRGIRHGWLAKDEYQPAVDRAWRAIKERTSPDGRLVNVCAGTGKQKTLQDYFDRPAINGHDERGGAMGMIFAVELMEVEPRRGN